MIEYVSGDFFDFDADIRINTVNCVGVMGAGVALSFKKKFPDMFTDYVNACKKNEIEPGKPHVWRETHSLFSSCIIINFPTKIHWKNPSEYEYIEKGLVWLRAFLLNNVNSVVTLPALGCGHGGLEWNKVNAMIIKYLGDLNSKILVFEPNCSTQTFIPRDLEIELKEKNVFKLLPNDEHYPLVLRGRSALEIYYKGNIELISNKSLNLVINPRPTSRENNAFMSFLNELPNDDFVFYLGVNNSYELDQAKEVLSRGFKVVFVVPQGLLQFKFRKDIDALLDLKKIVIVSITNPSKIWTKCESFNAFKLRIKLANATIINSLDLRNIAVFSKYLNKNNNKIFYINYWETEIDLFKNLGARKIGISRATMTPNVALLLKELRNSGF